MPVFFGGYMREKLADLCHRQWSGWMTYLYGKCSSNPDGTLTIPAWAVARWARQMSTKYEHLPEVEKESDREEADRFLALLAEENRHSV
jgi:hypothetical protein